MTKLIIVNVMHSLIADAMRLQRELRGVQQRVELERGLAIRALHFIPSLPASRKRPTYHSQLIKFSWAWTSPTYSFNCRASGIHAMQMLAPDSMPLAIRKWRCLLLHECFYECYPNNQPLSWRINRRKYSESQIFRCFDQWTGLSWARPMQTQSQHPYLNVSTVSIIDY